jgi:hypothetical protein
LYQGFIKSIANGLKYGTMYAHKLDRLTTFFLQGAGIEADDQDSIAIGYLNPYFAPAGIDAVMEKYTAHIDDLLQKLPQGSIEKLKLFIRRGFTFREYQALFDTTIRENSFSSYPVYRSLWITKEQERRRWTFTFSKESHDDYMTVLEKALSPFASWLMTFFFTSSHYGKSFSKKSFAPSCFTMW